MDEFFSAVFYEFNGCQATNKITTKMLNLTPSIFIAHIYAYIATSKKLLNIYTRARHFHIQIYPHDTKHTRVYHLAALMAYKYSIKRRWIKIVQFLLLESNLGESVCLTHIWSVQKRIYIY